MAQTVAVVRSTLSSAASGTTDFTKSGFGTPAAAIIIVCQANTTNNPQDNSEISIGFWDGTNQCVCMLQDRDNQANSDTRRNSDDSYGAIVVDSTSRSLYTVSAVTDGIRLTLSTDNTTLDRYCTVLLLAGVSAKVTNVTAGASAGNTVTSSSLGFAPDLVFFTGIGGTTVDVSGTTTALLSFGVAGDQSGIVQRVLGWGQSHASTNEASFERYSETRCFSRAALWTAECTALGSDDFTLTTRDGSSSSGIIFALALGGADLSFDLGTLTTPTSTGDSSVSTDITPAAVLAVLGTATGTSEYTDSAANGYMIGLADADGQFAHNAFVEDNAATMNTGSVASAAALVNLDTSSGGSRADMIDGTVTLNSSDFTINYSAVDATARKGWWVVFGSAGGGGVTSSFSAMVGSTSSESVASNRFASLSASAGTISASAAMKSASLGISIIAGSVGSAAGTKAASAGISAIAGLLGALETTLPGTAQWNAITGAAVAVTHSTARLSTIEAKLGSAASVVGVHQATRALQAIAGAVVSIEGPLDDDRTSTFEALAGTAIALSQSTARIASLVAKVGTLGADVAKSIRTAQIAAIAGLRAAIQAINPETTGALLTVAVSAQAAYSCAVSVAAAYSVALSERAAYNCTLTEAIVQ